VVDRLWTRTSAGFHQKNTKEFWVNLVWDMPWKLTAVNPSKSTVMNTIHISHIRLHKFCENGLLLECAAKLLEGIIPASSIYVQNYIMYKAQTTLGMFE
jgi:hypothetical protein